MFRKIFRRIMANALIKLIVTALSSLPIIGAAASLIAYVV
jgi:hypothetical protein